MNLASWLWRKTAGAGDAVYITERFGVRSLHIGTDTIQSAMRVARPNDLELAYTRSMMAFLLFHAWPERVLLVGLGGGSLVKFIYHRMPWARIDVIEVNPQVVAIARQCFHVPANDARLTVTIGNGAEHMSLPAEGADAILVDGYDGESQALELSSPEFYEACRGRLNSGGILVVNLWGSDRRFQDYLHRIEKAFPAGTLCLPADKPGNVIVFGFRDSPGTPRWEELEGRAPGLESRYGLEFERFVRGLKKMNRIDSERLYVHP